MLHPSSCLVRVTASLKYAILSAFATTEPCVRRPSSVHVGLPRPPSGVAWLGFGMGLIARRRNRARHPWSLPHHPRLVPSTPALSPSQQTMSDVCLLGRATPASYAPIAASSVGEAMIRGSLELARSTHARSPCCACVWPTVTAAALAGKSIAVGATGGCGPRACLRANERRAALVLGIERRAGVARRARARHASDMDLQHRGRGRCDLGSGRNLCADTR